MARDGPVYEPDSLLALAPACRAQPHCREAPLIRQIAPMNTIALAWIKPFGSARTRRLEAF